MSSRRKQKWAVYAVFSYLFWVNVWVADDALISFVHLHNFFNGDGLLINPGERVQAFTNTLWTLIHLPFYGLFIDEPSKAIFLLSMLVSFFVMLSLLRLTEKLLAFNEWILLMAIFMLSKSFIDFSSSGLETPLSYILLTLYCFYFLKFQKLKSPFLLGGLLSAMLILNRPDFGIFSMTIFFYCISYAFKTKSVSRLSRYFLGMVPLFIWLSFSLIYYGAFLPNTALAKLNLEYVSTSRYLLQGIWYVLATLVHDFWLFTVMVLGLLLPFFLRLKRELYYVYFSSLVYALYIASIGGDFMLGRFWLPSFTIFSFLLVKVEFYKYLNKYFIATVLLISLVVLYTEEHFTYNFSPERNIVNNIADEKQWYFHINGLYGIFHPSSLEKRKDRIEQNSIDNVAVVGTLGANGYFRKRGTYVLDKNALSDPLLARLPEVKKNFRPGHMRRNIPEGYLQSIKLDSNVIKDPNIRELYDDVRLATRSKNLFTKERWKAIWRLNNPLN